METVTVNASSYISIGNVFTDLWENGYPGITSTTYARIQRTAAADSFVSFSGFDFSTIPDDANVSSVTVSVKILQNAPPEETAYGEISFYLGYFNSIQKYSFTAYSYEGIKTMSQTFTDITRSQLGPSDVRFKAMVIWQDTIGYEYELYVYGIQVDVNYTVPNRVVTASAGQGGTISPSGSVSIVYKNSQTFTISPNSGYAIDTLIVDGVSVTPVSSYTFDNVTAGHSISATFKQLFNRAIAGAKQREWFLKGR